MTERKLRVGLVSLHTSPFSQPGTQDSGGLNVYVQQVAFALAHRGHDCTIYVRKTSPTQPNFEYIEPGVKVVHLEAGDYDLTLAELGNVTDEFADEMAARLEDTDNFGTDILHANYWLSGVVAHKLKHEFHLPLVTTFHTLGVAKQQVGEPIVAERIHHEKEITRCSDAIAVVSEAEADDLINHYGAEPERVHIIEAGVNSAYFSPNFLPDFSSGEKDGKDEEGIKNVKGEKGAKTEARKGLFLKHDIPVLMFAGRIQPLKQLSVAIKTLANLVEIPKYKNAELLVVGGPSGPEGEAALKEGKKLVSQFGLKRQVHFIEPQPHYLLSTYYRAADVVLMPSLNESFGLVALEAAACGIPVVASNVGGLANLIENYRTGILVDRATRSDQLEESSAQNNHPNKFVADFTSGVISILEGDSIGIGISAARKAEQYSWANVAQKLEMLYEESMSLNFVEC